MEFFSVAKPNCKITGGGGSRGVFIDNQQVTDMTGTLAMVNPANEFAHHVPLLR